MVSTSAPQGRGKKGSIPSRHRKQPEPQDWQQFTPSNRTAAQSKFGNVYYHCKPECIWLRYPAFSNDDLEISEYTKEKLNTVHKQHLAAAFGLEL